MNKNVKDIYYDWIYNQICDNRFDYYGRLIDKLFNTEFRYSIVEDENRYEDGLSLRYKFSYATGVDTNVPEMEFPCTVLEMMVALSIRLETQFMHKMSKGCRTSQWFWEMVFNMGLNDMVNENYNEKKVNIILKRFLDRNYNKNGKGGLFVIDGLDKDLRDYEIWCQACWYLNGVE